MDRVSFTALKLHKGKKVRCYTVSGKREVVKEAELVEHRAAHETMA